MSSTHLVAAVFPDRDRALATREGLGRDYFHHRRLALTKRDWQSTHDKHAVADSHEVQSGTDGPVGPHGAVSVVHAPEDRSSGAAPLLESGGGLAYAVSRADTPRRSAIRIAEDA